jgi:hypothetical protein
MLPVELLQAARKIGGLPPIDEPEGADAG